MTSIISRQFLSRFVDMVVPYNYMLAVVKKKMHGETNYFLRLTTLEMESIVDAAHIYQFHDSRNNDPRNGMALTKNAHWQFDRGLWSLNDDYRVLVNREKFIEDGVPGQRLTDFQGRKIFLPGDPKYWPEQTYLDWHRKRHGFPN